MKKFCLSFLLCLFGIATALSRNVSVADSSVGSEKWVRTVFVKNESLPFSFKLDGKPSDEFLPRWSRKLLDAAVDESGVRRYELVMNSPDGTLRLSCHIVTYADFPAVEWTLHFKNTGNGNSPQISDIKAVDLNLRGKESTGYTLYTAQGCHAIDRDFHLLKTELKADTVYRYMPTGGRPSSKTAFPFYNIDTDAGCGVFFSLGWTGNWFARFSADGKGRLTLRAGMPDTDLFLYPGESICTPLVSLLFWTGDNRLDGNNAFRRFVLAHHSPRTGSGDMITPPLCSGFDYGDPAPCGEYESFTELLARAVIQRHRQFGIMPEVFWLDAGWYYGCCAPESSYEGRNWYTTVGSWVADSVRFPGGLKAVADAVHENGCEFMVWFEPERVYAGSIFDRKFPQWLLSTPQTGGHKLLNIGNPDACDFLCRYIGDFLEENGIDHFRQDFNINPRIFWAQADSAMRKGITEIRYVEGLYRFWDYLSERFPNMIIDNCASGGRRLDLETISRAIPLWRTDCHYGEPTCQQCHEYGLSQFLPLHGTGIYYADKYCSRSGLSSAYAWFGEVFSRTNSVSDMRHMLSTYRDLRGYFLCDYYPLSGDGDVTGTDKWIAWQFHDRDRDCGIVQAFRRDDSSENSYTVSLMGLDSGALYDIYNEDNGITVTKSGKELACGLLLYLSEPRTSLLLRYRRVE